MGVKHADIRATRRLPVAALALLLTVAGGAVLPASGAAAVATIGTPTSGFGNGNSLSSCSSCTQVQQTAPGYTLSVPANGTITAWRVAGRGTLALRVMRANSGLLFAIAASAPQSIGANSLATFPTNLPVLAGDQIGVDLLPSSPAAQVRFTPLSGSRLLQDQPAIAPGGQLRGLSSLSGAISLNADVALAPVATGIDVPAGTNAGGTTVTISGTYLDGANGVTFGGIAASFSLNAAGALVAHTPAHPAGPVDVVVSGPGGSSTLTGAFTYVALTPTMLLGQPGTSTQPPPPGAPVISNFKLSKTAFLAAATTADATRTGTTLSYSLSETATAHFAVQHLVPGRLVRGRGGQGHFCQAAVHAVPAALRCTQIAALGPVLTQRAGNGPNALRFTGRLGGRTLAPGSYRFVATAIDSAGRTSAAGTHGFRILAPPARHCPQAHGSAGATTC